MEGHPSECRIAAASHMTILSYPRRDVKVLLLALVIARVGAPAYTRPPIQHREGCRTGGLSFGAPPALVVIVVAPLAKVG